MPIEISAKADCLLLACDTTCPNGQQFLQAWVDEDGRAQLRQQGFRYVIGLKARHPDLTLPRPQNICTAVRDIPAVIRYLCELIDVADIALRPRVFEFRLDGLRDADIDTVADAVEEYVNAKNLAALKICDVQGHA
jgi:hypothetical protein